MFSTAKKVASAPASAKAKPSKPAAETIDGLEEVAALDACMKAIKGLLDLKKDALKAIATKRLIARGIERHSKPDGLTLSAGEFATGTVSISKRAVSAPFTTDELEVLAEAVGTAERDEDGNVISIPGFAETVEQSPAMLAVNPAYAGDEMLLKRIDKALSGIKGIPEDFILSIPAATKTIVTETATDAVFRLAPEMVTQVFSMIAGVSCGAAHKDIGTAWDMVREMLVPADAKSDLRSMLKASAKADAA